MNLQVTFRNLRRSEAITQHVERQAEKLGTFCDRIVSCHVAIEAPHRHHHGTPYRVRIDLAVPGQEIVAGDTGASETVDVHAAIDAAFEQAKRQVKDHVHKQRGDVKTPRQSANEAWLVGGTK